ncbi:hypothetical protein [Sorangium sp. So ce1099]|uniref:hypothetical protein n=1 Tax=Sorangium sp. So ce1099 TaxID=3133331 RepID=UPI003F610461
MRSTHEPQHVEETAKTAKMCEKCVSLLESGADISAVVRARRVPLLRTESQFTEYGVAASKERHWARQDGILAKYNTRETTRKVVCSFPDHTAHFDGVVVRTLCGSIVSIGHVCAGRWIEKYEHVRGFMLREDAMARRLDALRSQPNELSTDLQDLSRRAKRLHELRAQFQRLVSELAEEMTRRQTAATGSNTAVEFKERVFDPATGQHKADFRIEHLTGLEWWDPQASPERIERSALQAQELVEAVRQAGMAGELDDEGSVARLYSQLQDVHSLRKDAETWVSSREKFFSAPNVKRVVKATDAHRIAAAGKRFRFYHQGRVCFLGLDGFDRE